jgi:lysophospholipase L1-like esterase
MKKISVNPLWLLVLRFEIMACFACVGLLAAAQKPAFESEISAFEMADRLNPPPPGVIVFTGSSSIRLWSTLTEDMKPLDVTNRGFGGSQIDEVNRYAPQIVFPYRPRAVVLYAGDNDLSASSPKTPEQVCDDFKNFVQIVHSQFPETRIYFVSIKPSIQRWNLWPQFRKANARIAQYIASAPRVEFIDVTSAMLDAQGKPRADIFREDGLHMNEKGYAIWTAIIKPRLLKENAAITRQPR